MRSFDAHLDFCGLENLEIKGKTSLLALPKNLNSLRISLDKVDKIKIPNRRKDRQEFLSLVYLFLPLFVWRTKYNTVTYNWGDSIYFLVVNKILCGQGRSITAVAVPPYMKKGRRLSL